ncbi:uncharacterized protein EDB93DRAFT_1250964 [Suillus bovinus]|uniref:uncharacterized protein n=1 Tax=Suillus bovinus TaxID=48563 RepID=UPI001B874C5B|nr:uncharacterized protein EDB93DRAFT_1250964 [Suillus bovinus]KAG2146430.1 hypothetical protein EDB93DRAFT_1250964 [Suillus bovinus]
MLHPYRDVFQTFPAYRKGSRPVTPDADRSSESHRRPGSQHRPKLKYQLVSQTTSVRSDSDEEASSLPLVWVEVRDNIIPPHAVPFTSDSHGPLFIARAYLEGTFCLGKAGPQLTSGAIISYGSQDITVARYDVLVCAGRLSWGIPHSSGAGFMRQDTMITRHDINSDIERTLMYRQDISENAHNLADNHDRVDHGQRAATPDPNPAIIASHTRTQRSNSTYGLSSKTLDVNMLKACDTSISLKSPLELTQRSRSLPPRARTSAESSLDARAELGTFQRDIAQSASVTTVITSATRRPEYAPVSRPNAVASSKPRVRLDCAIQESHRLSTVVSAAEYSASEQRTPVRSFGGSKITGFREAMNVDDWSEYSSPPPEPPAQSAHAGFVQDVLPLRRYPNTGITASTPVDHHTTQFLSTSATNYSLASNTINPRFINSSNPSLKDDSQVTSTHRSFSSHKMSSDSPLPRTSTAFSRGTWAGTQGSPVLGLCTLDDVKGTSIYESKPANYPVHPPADNIGTSADLGDFGHVDQYDQWAYPVAKAHVWQSDVQDTKYQPKDSSSHVSRPPTFPSTEPPSAQISLVSDRTDVDLRSTHYSNHGMSKSPTETSSEDGSMTTLEEQVCGCGLERVCDSEHWQLVSRTTFGIEAQTCDGAESDVVTSELPAPIAINPSNAGIVTGEVDVLPDPVPHVTSMSQIARDSRQGHSHVVVQEYALERELIRENRVAVTALSQTTSTAELTSDVACRENLVAEKSAPLSTITCTPSLPPSQRQSAQTISCSDDSVTDDKLRRHREYADSSVLACVSLAHEENNTSTRIIAVESTQKPSPASNDCPNTFFTESTLTTVKSPSLTVDRHEEPYSQDATKDKPSQVSSTLKLDEDVSIDNMRQTVEGREDYREKGTESEVKSNLTSCSRTVGMVEGYMSKSVVLDNDRGVNKGADGAALSLSSVNPESKVLSPSGPSVPQDSGTETDRIESGYGHRSLGVETVSKISVQISSHDLTESSEGYVQRQSALNVSFGDERVTDDKLNRGHEEVDSSVLVRSPLVPAENIGTPASATRRAVENTQKSSQASNDLTDSSLPEGTWMMGTTQGSSTPNVHVEHERVLESSDYMHQDLDGRGEYHARQANSEVTLRTKSYSSAVESLGQSESAMVLNASGRSDEQPNQYFPAPKSDSNEQADCVHQTSESRGLHELETESELMISHSHSVERSTSKTAVSKNTTQMDEDTNVPALPPSQMTTLAPSNPGILQSMGVDFIQSGVETGSIHLVQTSNHDCSTESKGYRSPQSFSCSEEPEATSSVHVCPSLAPNTSDLPSSMDKAVDNLQKSSLVSNEISRSSITSTCHNQSLVASTHEESCGRDMTNGQLQSSSSPTRETDKEGGLADHVHQAVIELRCEPQSLDINKVSNTFESEHTSSHHSLESSEWHTQRQRDYHAEVTFKSKFDSNTVESVRQSESAMVSNAGSQSDKDTYSNISSLSSTYAERQLSLSEPDIPQGAGINRTQSVHEHRSSDINVALTTFAQTSSQHSIENGVQSPLATIQEGLCCQYVAVDQPCQRSSASKLDGNEPAEYVHQTVERRASRYELETESDVMTSHSDSVRTVERSTLETSGWTSKIQSQVDEDTNVPTLLSSRMSTLSPSDLGIPQDAGVYFIQCGRENQSSGVKTASTDHVQTSNYSCSIKSEKYRSAQSSSHSFEHRSISPVHVSPSLAQNDSNSPPYMYKAVENTQKSSSISNEISVSSFTSTTCQSHSLVASTQEEYHDQDMIKDQPNKCSSSPKNEAHEDGVTAEDVAANFVRSECGHHFTEDINISAMSKYASSNYSTDNSDGCVYLSNSSQQSNNPPGMMSVPPMHEGPSPAPPAFYPVLHDSLNCSCVSHVIIASPVSIKDDSKAVGVSDVVEKSVSSDDNHPTPCAEGIPCVEPQENDCMKAGQTVASATCHSNIAQTSCRMENQDNTSSAAGTTCCTRESCDTTSKHSDDRGACTATMAPNDSPLADEQLKKTGATDCASECCATAESLPVDSCCPGPNGPASYVSSILKLTL